MSDYEIILDDHPVDEIEVIIADTIYTKPVEWGGIGGTLSDQTDLWAKISTYDSHVADGTIHFTEGSIDHLNIQNIGVNSHAVIDTKISTYDSHVADGTIHFTEGSIDHLNIQNIGVNSHAVIDTFINNFSLGTSDYQTLVWDADNTKYIPNDILKINFDTSNVLTQGTQNIIDNSGNPQQTWSHTAGSIESSLTVGADGITTLATSGGSFIFPSGSVENPAISFPDGNSGFYQNVAGNLNISITGLARWIINSSGIFSVKALGPFLKDSNVSDTNPTLLPSRSDTNTGIGSADLDKLSFIAGGIEGIRISEVTGIITNDIFGNFNLNSNDILGIGTATATTFSGDLNGTINTATTGVTQAPLDNSTKIATTAYVDAAVLVEDLWNRVGTVISPKVAGDDITTTGDITATTFLGDLNGTINTATTGVTQAPLDNSTKIATTAYVDAAVLVEDLWDRVGTVISPKVAGDDISTTGDITATTFLGDLNGTINTATTGVTQSPLDNSTKIATTAYVDAAVLVEDLWNRVGTVISPKVAGDDISTTGDISCGLADFTGLTVAKSSGSNDIYFTTSGTSNVNIRMDNSLRSGRVLTRAPGGEVYFGDIDNNFAPVILRAGGANVLLIDRFKVSDFYGGNLTNIGTATATTFSGDLNGTINTATTGVTQAPLDNSTKIATTAYVDAAVLVEDLWDRVGTVISPKVAGDDISTTGDITGNNFIVNGTFTQQGNDSIFNANYSDSDFVIRSYSAIGSFDAFIFDAAANQHTFGSPVTIFTQGDENRLRLQRGGQNDLTFYMDSGSTRIIENALKGLILGTAQESAFFIETNNEVRMKIEGTGDGFFSGKMGFGIETTPENPIHIRGNVSIADVNARTQYLMQIEHSGSATGEYHGICFTNDSLVSSAFINVDRGSNNRSALDIYTDSEAGVERVARFDYNNKTYLYGDLDVSGTINGAKLYNLGTGVLSGCELSVNSGDNTLLDIAAGEVFISNYSTPDSPVFTKVTVAAQTVFPDLSTSWNKWVGVNASGTILFDPEFTQLEKRTIAIIGRCWGSGLDDVINNVGDYKTPAFGQLYLADDMAYVIGSMNKYGNVYSANGANLLLNKSIGKSFRKGAFWSDSPQSPNVAPNDPAQTGISSYYYHLQGVITADIQTDIEPNYYDNAGTKTAVPAGKFTVQRLYFYPKSQVLFVTYGQAIYSSMVAAVTAAGEEDLNLSQELLDGSILRGWIALSQGATALNNPNQAIFIEASSINDPRPIGIDNQITGEVIFQPASPVTTTITTQSAWIQLNTGGGAVGDQEENITVNSDGTVTLDALFPCRLAADCNVRLLPTTGTNQEVETSIFGISSASLPITFDNTTNIINMTNTPLSDNDVISFYRTTSTLPAELAKNIFYFVVNKTTNTFQISYTLGGAAIAFTDNGTGSHVLSPTRQSGCTAGASLSVGLAKDFIPQGLATPLTGNIFAIAIRNNTSTNDINCERLYARAMKAT